MPNPNYVQSDPEFADGYMWKIQPGQQIFPDNTVKPADVVPSRYETGYLTSILRGLAEKDPDQLRNMITINADDTVTVHFYQLNKDGKGKTPLDVTVNASVDLHIEEDSALWVRLIEKAIVAGDLLKHAKPNSYHHMTELYNGRPDQIAEFFYSDIPVPVNHSDQLKAAENLETAKKMFVEDLRRVLDANGVMTIYDESLNATMQVTGLSERDGELGFQYYDHFTPSEEGWISIDTLFDDHYSVNAFYKDKNGQRYIYKETPNEIQKHIADRKTIDDYTGNPGPWAFVTKESLTKPVDFAFFKDYVTKVEGSPEKIDAKTFAEYMVCSQMIYLGQEEYEKHSVTLRRLNKMLNDQVTENGMVNRLFYDVLGKCSPVTLQQANAVHMNIAGALSANLKVAMNLYVPMVNNLKTFGTYSKDFDPDELLQMEKENRLIDSSDLEGSMNRVFILETFRQIALSVNARVELDAEMAETVNQNPIMQKACAFAKKLDPKAVQQEVDRTREFLNSLKEKQKQEEAETKKREEEAEQRRLKEEEAKQNRLKEEEAEQNRLKEEEAEQNRLKEEAGKKKEPEAMADKAVKKYTYERLKKYLESKLPHDEKGNIKDVVANGNHFICRKMLEELNRIGKQKFDEAGYSDVELQNLYSDIKTPYEGFMNLFQRDSVFKAFKNISYEEVNSVYELLVKYAGVLEQARNLKPEETLKQQALYERVRGELPVNLDVNDVEKQMKLAKETNHLAEFFKYRLFGRVLDQLPRNDKKLEAMEAEYQKYAVLDYDREQVNRNLQDYVAAHPELSQEQIEQKKEDLVIQETILSSYEKAAVRSEIPLEFKEKLVSDLKNAMQSKHLNEYEFFEKCPKQKLLPYLQAFQQRLERAGNQDTTNYQQMITREYAAVLEKSALRTYNENYGQVFHKGLFAGKPDPKGMLFTFRGKPYPLLEKWQKDINNIVMEPGEYLKNEDLLEFAVMGNFLSDKVSERMRKQQNDKAEIYYDVDTIHMTYFENMLLNSNTRDDDIELRGLVAEARQEVKDAIDQNTPESQKALKADLQSAFDAMYNHIAKVKQVTDSSFCYCLANLEKLLKQTKKAGIELNVSEEKRKNMEVLQATRNLVQSYSALSDKLRMKAADMLHDDFNDPSYDPSKNPDLYDDIVTVHALQLIIHNINKEAETVNAYYDDENGNMMPRTSDLDLTMTEIMLAEKKEEFISYYKNRVCQGNDLKAVLDTKTVSERFQNLARGGVAHLPEKSNYIYHDACAYEKDGASWDIKGILADFDGAVKEYDENLDPKEHEDKAKVRRNLKNIREAFIKLSEARAKIAEPWKEENVEKLAPYYKAYADAFRPYDNICNFDDRYEISINGNPKLLFSMRRLAAQGENLKTWKLNQEEQRRISHILENLKIKTNFEKFYEETYRNLDNLILEKNAGEHFGALLSDMRQLYEMLHGDELRTGAQILGHKGYDQVLADVDRLLTEKHKGVDEDLKYLLISLKAQLCADQEDIGTLVSGEDFSKDLEVFRYDFNKEINTNHNERLKHAMEQMDHVSFRAGGNSDEFKDILKKMETVKSLQAKGNTLSNDYLNAVIALEESTNVYIRAKKIVPGSLKGKDRLRIAKSIRDISGTLSSSVYKGIGKSAKEKALTGYDDVMKQIKKNKLSAMRQLEDGYEIFNMHAKTDTFEDNNYKNILKTNLIDSASRYLYWDRLERAAYGFNPTQLNQLCDEKTAKSQIALIAPGMKEALSFEKLGNAIKNHSVAEMLCDSVKPFLKPGDMKKLAENPGRFQLFERKQAGIPIPAVEKKLQ